MPATDAQRPDANQRRQTRLFSTLFATVVFALAYQGWRLFYFITDDAYIAFRYVSNSMAGRGFVWNPAPFHPVEGYTSFLWIVLLKGVWLFTGFEPPDCANAISFFFALGTLYLAYRFVARMDLPAPFARWRWGLIAFVLVGTLTNRTFLAWMSSGLETACFNFLLTWWLYEAMSRSHSPWRVLRLSTAAALTALCRPDGLLFALATPVILALEQAPLASWAACAPLVAVPVHLLWRHHFYGYWLPNTYYAKYVTAWPEAGVRYLGSFMLEYGVWLWALLALPWFIRALRALRHPSREMLARVVPVAALLAHSGYYTLIIGGDHFEYRVYSQWVPLLFISAVWLATRWIRRTETLSLALAAFLLVSWPIPWMHWWKTRNLSGRDETRALVMPIAQDFPAPMRPIVSLWDGWQAWLIEHFICNRHQEHKVFMQFRYGIFPTRSLGSEIPLAEHDLVSGGSVGLLGWVVPNIFVIDEHGLNDIVIARTPPSPDDPRLMAHEREPPPGYIQCFVPNVEFDGEGGVRVAQRTLTDEAIRSCESRAWPRPK